MNLKANNSRCRPSRVEKERANKRKVEKKACEQINWNDTRMGLLAGWRKKCSRLESKWRGKMAGWDTDGKEARQS